MKYLISLLLTVFSIHYGLSQCPKAQEYIDKVKDANENWTPDERMRNNCPQVWSQIGAWHVHKCQSDKGVASVEDAERLVATMNATQNNIMNMGSGCGPVPPLMTVEQVKIIGENSSPTNPDGTKSGFDNPTQKRLVKDEYLDLINLLSDNIESELLSETADDLNYLRNYAEKLRIQFPDQADKVVEMENVGMAISITANILESFLKKIKSKNVESSTTYWVNSNPVVLTESQWENYSIKLPKPPTAEDIQATNEFLNKIFPPKSYSEQGVQILNQFGEQSLKKISSTYYNNLRVNQFLAMIQDDNKKLLEAISSKVQFLDNKVEENQCFNLYKGLQDQQFPNLSIRYRVNRLQVLYPWLNNNPDWSESDMIKYLNKHVPIEMVYWPINIQGDSLIRSDGSIVSIQQDYKNNLEFLYNTTIKTDFGYHQHGKNYRSYLSETYLPIFELTQDFDASYSQIKKLVSYNLGLKHALQPLNAVDIFQGISIEYNPNSPNEGYLGLGSSSTHCAYQNFYSHLARLSMNSTFQVIDFDLLNESLISNSPSSISQKEDFKIGFALLKSSYYRNTGQYDRAEEELSSIYDIVGDTTFNFNNLLSDFNFILKLTEPYVKRKKKDEEKLATQGEKWNKRKDWTLHLIYEHLLLNVSNGNSLEEQYNNVCDILKMVKTVPESNSFPRLYFTKVNGVKTANRIDLFYNIKDLSIKNTPILGWKSGDEFEYLKPFSSLFLYRYYLGKKLNKTEYLESDAQYIRDNLVFVLEDYIRNTTDYSPAQFVLKDLGIIE